jgi:hypothetical protein
VIRRLIVIAFLVAATVAQSSPVEASGVVPGPCVRGTLPHGALSLMCVPASGWNGDLVVFAHGYVAFDRPLDFYHITLPDGTSVPTLVQSLGYAFATTSYRTNGLAVLDGVDDVRELVHAFGRWAPRAPTRTFLVGVSEGGLVVALSIERSPELYSGALAACGPIGSFRAQVDYVGDVRVLFDYFFPGVIPGSATQIPAEVIRNWDSVYVPRVLAALSARPTVAGELATVAKLPLDWSDLWTSLTEGLVGVLWYNIFGTNDAVAKLGGNPYGNIGRVYAGSSDDALLNARVARVAADTTALGHLSRYETSGQLARPVVTLHTLGDEIVPFWHELFYYWKVTTAGSGTLLITLPVAAYGHCIFTAEQLLGSFVLLASRVATPTPN